MVSRAHGAHGAARLTTMTALAAQTLAVRKRGAGGESRGQGRLVQMKRQWSCQHDSTSRTKLGSRQWRRGKSGLSSFFATSLTSCSGCWLSQGTRSLASPHRTMCIDEFVSSLLRDKLCRSPSPLKYHKSLLSPTSATIVDLIHRRPPHAQSPTSPTVTHLTHRRPPQPPSPPPQGYKAWIV